MIPRKKRFAAFSIITLFLLSGSAEKIFAQAEGTPWGNLTGIRVDGQLMKFETSLRVVRPDWSEFFQTSKNIQRPRFTRNGNKQTIATRLDDVLIYEVIEDTGPGAVAVDLKFTADADSAIAGGYFCLDLPGADYYGGEVQLTGASPSSPAKIALDAAAGPREYVRGSARGARFASRRRQIDLAWNGAAEIIVRKNPLREGIIQVFVSVLPANPKKGQVAQNLFQFKVGGEIDKNPVLITLDSSRPGRAWDGIGGNFRLQFPDADPAIIQYCLDNLRVAWSRVEMPWRNWDPDESADPLKAARAGKLDERVANAMNMARRLTQRGIPVIVSAWFPPQWAVLGEVQGRGTAAGQQVQARQQPQSFQIAASEPPNAVRGNQLNPAKLNRIYESIAGYLTLLKERYGVEANSFSFNESDIGVNVRQTAEEHASLIKNLGAFLASKHLATKLLLGDTLGDLEWKGAHGFIKPAMDDPETHKYIAAIAFHSWRINSNENLIGWAEAAAKLNVPLMVTEGGPDSHAHEYPDIFVEPTFQMEEIDQYIRIAALCQPSSIIQWQLTADYTPLYGGGAYGNNQPLKTTQRFWNLKQLGATPAGSFALPVMCDRPDISSAGFGHLANGIYTVHMVNNGATRPLTITGFPDSVKEVRVYVTDFKRGMEEGKRVPVTNGKAQLTIDSMSYTTVMSVPTAAMP